MRQTRWLYILIGLAALLAVAGTGLATFYTNILWFQKVGYLSVFMKILSARATVGLLGGLFFFLVTYVNLRIVLWNRTQLTLVGGLVMPVPLSVTRRVGTFMLLASAVVGVLGGLAAYTQWHVILAFFYQTPFGIADPLFGKDAGFYIFSLPFIRLVQQHLWVALVAASVVSAAAYFLFGDLRFAPRRVILDRRARTHLSVLAASLFALKAWGYQISIWDLMYSPRGAAFGPSYTDVNAQVPAYKILVVVAALGAVLSLMGIAIRSFKWVGYSAAALVVLGLLAGYAYPSFMQQFTVSPNELAYEIPFIEHNIRFTRSAFGLDRIESVSFPATEDLTIADIQATPDIVRNFRLWDYRVMKDTYTQLQEIRMYYKFNDVDIDRYRIGGQYRQVLLSARELDIGSLPQDARTWINLHLKYTHGYGIVMSPISEMEGAGRPSFYFSDIPPVSATDLQVLRPELYFGEMANHYIIVNTKEPEFDYPRSDTEANEPTFYSGTAGVPLKSFLTRLAFALRFADYQILVSGAITPESRLVMRRNIYDRIQTVAPFFMYDNDPYIVLAEGKLYWIVDGYTVSANYPYSQPDSETGINYIRNSVKVVIDAYDGTLTFYQADTDDPIINTYAKIFPGLLKPLDSMPSYLKEHIRYPVELFRIQSRVLLTYHMTDPRVFYNKEDYWETPKEIYGGSRMEQPVEPYYIVTILPGETEPEYLLITPFTPRGKPNMTAWLGARCDPDKYGHMVLFLLPKSKLVPGPMQVESLFSQNPAISQATTLWGQGGSEVIRGNLISIPIKNSLLYVEPLYIQAAQVKIPELKRVLMYYGGRVVMGTTIEDALGQLFGDGLPEGPDGLPGPGRDVAGLAADAARLWREAQDLIQAGDWAGYGRAIEELGRVLSELESLTGGSAAESPVMPESPIQ
ncbi:MAG TPA: UPF0182 family protein [Firmicutes bacterium]|nr:UPF0182 family protein [Candidatus Fermentithermobacillaceae bacterium]